MVSIKKVAESLVVLYKRKELFVLKSVGVMALVVLLRKEGSLRTPIIIFWYTCTQHLQYAC